MGVPAVKEKRWAWQSRELALTMILRTIVIVPVLIIGIIITILKGSCIY